MSLHALRTKLSALAPRVSGSSAAVGYSSRFSSTTATKDFSVDDVRFVPPFEGERVEPVKPDSSRPQVYSRIKKELATLDLNSTVYERSKDHIESLWRAKEALNEPSLPRVRGRAEEVYGDFLERLKADGGDKVFTFRRNYLHVEYTRFIPLCDDVKGLTLNQALLQIEWYRKPITRKMKECITEAIVLAKEQGYDLNKTYIAEAYVKPEAVLSEKLTKNFIRGRGRYGSTPHIVSSILQLTLQEREKPFKKRLDDPLEFIRERLRERQQAYIVDAEQVYQTVRAKRPIKPVYC
ncbi:uncharacterized protein BJ171DRAFT_503945 [Polychytrium aggregatum]|uniref:uncharacterized protein n=1 Tax=Polychytrium aggregatum TaxID=110093 RepID=UPI0022FDD2E5|nr:uncharacterized protein BJ171DRAFT_503945 [Polychytrium aggregatum]KAI9204882.1 hypothetical protein BJ171DRAFT_503945 [Polychytrium aggregatum]